METNPKVKAADEAASAQLMSVSSSSSTMETFKPDSSSSKRETDKQIKPDKKSKAAPKQEPPSLPPPPAQKEALPESESKKFEPEYGKTQKLSKKSTASSSTDKYEGISKKVKKDAGQLKSNSRSIQKGVEKIEGVKTPKFWERQNIATLKEQAELRGYRFTDLETKGGIVPGSGSMIKQKKFKKEDYLKVLLKLLKEKDEV